MGAYDAYPEGFVNACQKVYEKIGPLSHANEILGCWVFSTSEVLYISGPMAVKIDTGEVLHFHIPALMAEDGHAEKMAGKLGVSIRELLDTLLGEEAEYPRIEVPDRFKQRPSTWGIQGLGQ